MLLQQHYTEVFRDVDFVWQNPMLAIAVDKYEFDWSNNNDNGFF